METIYDALRGAIDELGGPKVVAMRMRPERTQDEARTWLLNCLNPDRAEKLDPEQVLWILRESRRAGKHGAIYWLTDDVGYSHPLPVTSESDTERLQREFIAAVDRQALLIAQMRAARVNVEGMGG